MTDKAMGSSLRDHLRSANWTTLLRHDRAITVGGLLLVTVISWGYLLSGAGMAMNAFEMTAASFGRRAMMPGAVDWTFTTAVVMYGMWWTMMVAMMLPSAAPMILLFAAIGRKSGKGMAGTLLFLASYLLVWGSFSLAAVGLQWLLLRSGLLSGVLVTTAPFLGSALLIGAGVWQLSPIKRRCLHKCRSPIGFLMQRYRPGPAAAFGMGLEHGLYCLGCCWFLMLLLFYGGVMNLAWIGGLALFVLLEKLTPPGHWITVSSGLVMIAWGILLIL